MRKVIMMIALTLMAINLSAKNYTNTQVSILPAPTELEVVDGSFTINNKTVIYTDFQDESIDFVVAELRRKASLVNINKIKRVQYYPLKNCIIIKQNNDPNKESYKLEISSKNIIIYAPTPQGAFYAIQSLFQLFPWKSLKAKDVTSISIPCINVTDKPHFTYRGVHLDVCRHFYTVDEVKKVIDIAALHKLNKFHWHLTEDQGWRIEIKKYPLLTEIGSRRDDSQMAGYSSRSKMEGVPYGPFFYTQDQIRDVVEYAQERFITVIPEIEIPGHSVAALAAYPWLGCRGDQYKVWTHWGISKEVACPGKETTFTFWEDVLSEVMALFPSEFIHIGGDECPRDEWKKCPHCQKRIKDEGLENEAQLQSYINRRIETFLALHNRKMIGWDEILQGGVTKSSIVMSWRGSKGGIAAARMGNDVIMTPNSHCYFDYPQGTGEYEPLFPNKKHMLPLETVYELDPYKDLTMDEQVHILGVQCNMWTEHVKTMSHIEYMLLPRLAAIAETGWSYPEKNFPKFIKNLEHLTLFYKGLGYNYSNTYWRTHPEK